MVLCRFASLKNITVKNFCFSAKAPSIKHQERDAYFTQYYLSLHYSSAQLAKLETPGPTYSFDIMYCQCTSQPTNVQDTVMPYHLTYSMVKVEFFVKYDFT